MSKAARQKEANRRNSALSTGPRTEEGKACSSQNATTHGLTSRTVVLPHESEAEYNQLRDRIIESHQPETDLERTFAILIAEAFWKRERMYRIETAFLASRMQGELAGDDALVTLFTDPTEMNRLRLLLRYLTAAERAYTKAVADLEKLQKQRVASDPAEQIAQPEPAPAAPIGFVSKSEFVAPLQAHVDIHSRAEQAKAA